MGCVEESNISNVEYNTSDDESDKEDCILNNTDKKNKLKLNPENNKLKSNENNLIYEKKNLSNKNIKDNFFSGNITNCTNKYNIIKKIDNFPYELYKIEEINNKNEIRMLHKIKIKQSETDLNQLINETKMLANIKGEEILELYECYLNEYDYYIISEYWDYGNLADLLKQHIKFSENQIKDVAMQLFKCLINIIDQNFVLIEINPDKIMIKDIFENDKGEKLYKIKYQHFGYSDRNNISFYKAPEVLKNTFHFTSAVWSIGVILYQMMFGFVPFSGDNNDEILFNITCCNFLPKNVKISNSFKDLLKKIFNINVLQRININQCVNHPWFINENDNNNNNENNDENNNEKGKENSNEDNNENINENNNENNKENKNENDDIKECKLALDTLENNEGNNTDNFDVKVNIVLVSEGNLVDTSERNSDNSLMEKNEEKNKQNEKEKKNNGEKNEQEKNNEKELVDKKEKKEEENIIINKGESKKDENEKNSNDEENRTIDKEENKKDKKEEYKENNLTNKDEVLMFGEKNRNITNNRQNDITNDDIIKKIFCNFNIQNKTAKKSVNNKIQINKIKYDTKIITLAIKTIKYIKYYLKVNFEVDKEKNKLSNLFNSLSDDIQIISYEKIKNIYSSFNKKRLSINLIYNNIYKNLYDNIFNELNKEQKQFFTKDEFIDLIFKFKKKNYEKELKIAFDKLMKSNKEEILECFHYMEQNEKYKKYKKYFDEMKKIVVNNKYKEIYIFNDYLYILQFAMNNVLI